MAAHDEPTPKAGDRRERPVEFFVDSGGAILPMDRHSIEERTLKLAGYSDDQIVKLLARSYERAHRAA
jgi:hypothetical protein